MISLRPNMRPILTDQSTPFPTEPKIIPNYSISPDMTFKTLRNMHKKNVKSVFFKVHDDDRGTGAAAGPIGAQTLAETWSLHCY